MPPAGRCDRATKSPTPTAQGKFKAAKVSNPIKKQKKVRSDQQKLKHGNSVIRPKGNTSLAAMDYSVQSRITKQINERIEKTMTARSSKDGGGHNLLKADPEAADMAKSLKNSSFSAKQKR